MLIQFSQEKIEPKEMRHILKHTKGLGGNKPKGLACSIADVMFTENPRTRRKKIKDLLSVARKRKAGNIKP